MELYSVQRITGDAVESLASCVTVEAQCPVGAGELVLSQPLALHGDTVLARIWYLKEDYTPQSVNLYAVPTAQ